MHVYIKRIFLYIGIIYICFFIVKGIRLISTFAIKKPSKNAVVW